MVEFKNETGVHVRELCGVLSAPWRAMINPSPGPAACGQGEIEREKFLNPRGGIIDAAVDAVLDFLPGGRDVATLAASLEPYMKLQALEAPSAEEAVVFLDTLKALSRETAEKTGKPGLVDAARSIEQSLEEMIGIAAGMYRKYRLLLVDLSGAEKRRNTVRNLRKVK